MKDIYKKWRKILWWCLTMAAVTACLLTFTFPMIILSPLLLFGPFSSTSSHIALSENFYSYAKWQWQMSLSFHWISIYSHIFTERKQESPKMLESIRVKRKNVLFQLLCKNSWNVFVYIQEEILQPFSCILHNISWLDTGTNTNWDVTFWLSLALKCGIYEFK